MLHLFTTGESCSFSCGLASIVFCMLVRLVHTGKDICFHYVMEVYTLLKIIKGFCASSNDHLTSIFFSFFLVSQNITS